MNKNELIGTVIGKGLAYTVKGVGFLKLSELISPQGVILVKGGSKIINYVSKNYVRTDFSSEKIFSDAIDGSFFAD